MSDPFATSTAFRAWLLKHADWETVGYSPDPYDAPEVRYLRESGYEGAYTTSDLWGCYGEHEGIYDMASWAHRFVLDMDRISVTKGREKRPVTRREALAILDAIESEGLLAGLADGLVAGAPAPEAR